VSLYDEIPGRFMLDLSKFNDLSDSEATAELLKCCGSRAWANRLDAERPFASFEDLLNKATEIWWKLDRHDWLEAFRSHPKIGEKKTATEISAQSQKWSGQEQRGLESSSQETLDELATLNREYEQKFGYIFIVCATGKSSTEMLALLRSRLTNDTETELPIAAGEQAKITEIRLRKLLSQ
jgi:OHCU decarboxylase